MCFRLSLVRASGICYIGPRDLPVWTTSNPDRTLAHSRAQYFLVLCPVILQPVCHRIPGPEIARPPITNERGEKAPIVSTILYIFKCFLETWPVQIDTLLYGYVWVAKLSLHVYVNRFHA